MNKVGRPSKFSKELTDKICAKIAAGKSVHQICKKDNMPDASSVYAWLSKGSNYPEENPEHAEFLDNYLRARESQADAIFDECLEIADDDNLDIGFNDEGAPFVKGENIQRSKLRVDTRMRMAGKLKPKKYGDSQFIKQAYEDAEGNQTNPPEINVVVVDNKDDSKQD